MGPLHAKRVLVTRPAGDGDDLIAELQQRGAIPLAAATIAFAPPDDPEPAIRAIADLNAYRWVVFTSARGVESFLASCDSCGIPVRSLSNLRAVAVGPKTAGILRAAGVPVEFMPERFSATDVGAALEHVSMPTDRVLVFRAQEGRDEAVEQLRAAGRRVDVVAGYKTVARHDDAIAQLSVQADILTFASGSAAAAFAQNVDLAAMQSKVVACIGRTTAQRTRDSGLHVDVIAAEATAAGLVDSLESYLRERAWD